MTSSTKTVAELHRQEADRLLAFVILRMHYFYGSEDPCRCEACRAARRVLGEPEPVEAP